jgi:hypothetical protein
LIEIKLPLEYPNVPPTLAFLTPIEHCNIFDGVPCPNLLFGSWSPMLTTHSVLTQLIQLLKEQSRGDALRPELAGLDDQAFRAVAQESVRSFASADQQFPVGSTASKKLGAGAGIVHWPHSYIILKAEVKSSSGDDAMLPRIKLRIGGPSALASMPAQPEGKGAVTAMEVLPVAEAIEAEVLAMQLELDGEELQATACYRLQPERAAIFSKLVDKLTPDNAVAVTCTSSSGVVETLVNVQTMEHCKFEDPILCTELAIPSLVEAQFEPNGKWVLSRGSMQNIEMEKASLFSRYEKAISMDPPECLSTLRKMLQSGPVTRLYTGGGDRRFIKSHEGFSLRMPSDELPNWQMLNDKGELQDIPRPALALRVWSAEKRRYDQVDALLNGAPVTPAAVDEWYTRTVKKLKSSNYVGSELLDKLVSSQRTVDMDALMDGNFDAAFEGHFSNRWTELVLATKL